MRYDGRGIFSFFGNSLLKGILKLEEPRIDSDLVLDLLPAMSSSAELAFEAARAALNGGITVVSSSVSYKLRFIKQWDYMLHNYWLVWISCF